MTMNWVKGVDGRGWGFTGYIVEAPNWEGVALVHITTCDNKKISGHTVQVNSETFIEYNLNTTHLTNEQFNTLMGVALEINDKRWFNRIAKEKNKLIGRLDTWKV